MAIHMNGSSSSAKSSTDSKKTKEVKVSAERYVIKIMKKGGRVRAYLGTLRQPKTAWLTEAEKDALKALPAFGGPRRQKFEFYYQPDLEKVESGRSWYWLCDVDGLEDREEVEALVDSVLAKPAKKASDVKEVQAKARKAAETKRGKAEAAKAKAPRKHAIVLG